MSRTPAGLLQAWREPATRAVARLIPGDVVWFVDTTDPVFALTFDDGPGASTTPALLEVLATHRAKATFFLVGERVEKHPGLVADIVAAGPVRWFRPGSGVFTPRMLRSAAEQNLRAVLGTLVAGNRGLPSDDRIARSLLPHIRPGSILVLHEGTPQRQGVVQTTDELLSALTDLTAVTVSDLVSRSRA